MRALARQRPSLRGGLRHARVAQTVESACRQMPHVDFATVPNATAVTLVKVVSHNAKDSTRVAKREDNTGAHLVLASDARRLPLPNESVDIIVTSPPYYALRSYKDVEGNEYEGQVGSEETPWEYLSNLIECTREMVRVLKPAGSIFVNLGDKYAAQGGPKTSGRSPSALLNNTGGSGEHQRAGLDRRGKGNASRIPSGCREKSLMLLPERYRIACTDQLQLVARAVVIWAKTSGMPESVKDRVRRSHEDWVHLTKNARYFENVDAIREERADGPPRIPGSVWPLSPTPLRHPDHISVQHYAPFPVEWPKKLITGWCPPRGVVLDPFGGTGTTALVADVLGRTGITLDASSAYSRVAAWRCADPKERARVVGKRTVRPTAASRGTPEQDSLFDLLKDAS